MTFDPSKPCKTKDGRFVEIITTDGREPYPIVGYVEDTLIPWLWYRTGKRSDLSPEDHDLINIPEPKLSGEVWVNFYLVTPPTSPATIDWRTYSTREMADRCSGPNRIACIHVPWTEGEGLKGK